MACLSFLFGEEGGERSQGKEISFSDSGRFFRRFDKFSSDVICSILMTVVIFGHNEMTLYHITSRPYTTVIYTMFTSILAQISAVASFFLFYSSYG